MSDLDDHIAELLQNPEFKKEWEASEAEYLAKVAVMNARRKSGLTQKELSDLSGVSQETISRIENGNMNASVKLLLKLAKGCNKNLKIEFID